MVLFYVAVGLFGCFIGSFLNVVIWRVPRGESVVTPRSACTSCGNVIRWLHNIPVLSWLFLRGKCAYCGQRISARYPLVELATGISFAGVTIWAGLTWALPAYLWLAAISIALSLIDWDTKTLPNRIVFPSYPVSLALLALAAWTPGGEPAWGRALDALICAAALLVLYFLIWWFFPGGMGFGDVKLAGLVGLHLGFIGIGVTVVGTFAAFFFGGSIAIALLVLKKVGRKTQLPFGPWMLIGAWFGIFWGSATWEWYLSVAL